MNTPIILSNLLSNLAQRLRPSCVSAIGLAAIVLAVGVPARSQEPPKPTESIVDAARNARQRKSNSATPPVIFTNDDIAAQPAPPVAAAVPPEPAATPAPPDSAPKLATAAAPQPSVAPAPPPATTDCHNPNEERLKSELQAAQDELDQLRRELSYNPQAISGPDVDMTNFKSGSSGLAFGSPPLQQSQPQAPARIDEVILEQRVTSLKEASRIACEPPKDAAVQRQIDSAENELELLQREFDLSQSAYYSKTNYAQDTTGKAQLDAQRQQIESLKSEISRLKDAIPPPKTNPPAQ
jgi:hypothetical protein